MAKSSLSRISAKHGNTATLPQPENKCLCLLIASGVAMATGFMCLGLERIASSPRIPPGFVSIAYTSNTEYAAIEDQAGGMLW